jgi:hypothetical protein
MKRLIELILIITITLILCKGETAKQETKPTRIPITGTWQLISGKVVEKGNT